MLQVARSRLGDPKELPARFRRHPSAISSHRYCVANHNVTLEEFSRWPCSSGLHIHCTGREVSELLRLGVVEDLAPVGDKRRGYVFRFKRMFAVRGLSARFGEELALMLQRDEGRSFARFVMSEIRRRPDHEDDIAAD